VQIYLFSLEFLRVQTKYFYAVLGSDHKERLSRGVKNFVVCMGEEKRLTKKNEERLLRERGRVRSLYTNKTFFVNSPLLELYENLVLKNSCQTFL
jgi:hypothetical protein